MSEKQRIKALSDWYLSEQLDFDKRLIRFRYETLKPYLLGPKGLELGPAEGEMTEFLLQDFEKLTIVEGASNLLKQIPDMDALAKVHSLFEEYEPRERFDSIIMEHILEHVEKPVSLLLRVKRWLTPGGRIFVGVPNGLSIHRLVAVKMGLLTEPCQLNQRDRALGHRRVYTRETLFADLHSAGLKVWKWGGVFFKPLPNKQIQDHWDESMVCGFYELGKDFPENAAELYAVCIDA